MKKYKVRLIVVDDNEHIISAANEKEAVKKAMEVNNTGYDFYDAMVTEISSIPVSNETLEV